MALLTPTWLQNGTYSARLDRIFADCLLTEGVIRPGAGSLQVTQRGAGANNSVDIAAGYAVITGDDAADQGNYVIRNDATVNLAASAAPVANSRIDLVCVRINDPAEGGPAGNNATFVYVTGTAAPVPVPPATPTSAIVLAQVLRTVGDTSVVAANITDVRAASLTLLSNTLTDAGDLFSFDGSNSVRIPLGATGLPLVAGATSPSYAAIGSAGIAAGAVGLSQLAANSVDSSKIVDGSVTGADIAATTITAANIAANTITRDKLNAEAWSSFVPSITGILNTTNTGRQRQAGGDVAFWAKFVVTTSPTVSGNFVVNLPLTAQADVQRSQFRAQFWDSSNSRAYPAMILNVSATQVTISAQQFPGLTASYNATPTNSIPFSWAAGDFIEVSGLYEKG